MKIQMLTLMAGPEGAVKAGDCIDVEKDIAAGLISSGYAVNAEKEVENDPVDSNGNGSANKPRRSKKASKASSGR